MKKLYIILFILFFQITVFSQDLKIFGYVQPTINRYNNVWGDPGPPPGESNFNYLYGGTSQLNLFLQKDLMNDLSVFVNFEMLNNFASRRDWGSFRIQEAYLRWQATDNIDMKFGYFIPRFNQMYEIYNRTPLLPYVLRPQLYEAVTGNVVDIFKLLPSAGLVQIAGYIPIERAKLDFALYINHPTDGYFSSKENDLLPGYTAFGQSSIAFLGYGGRIGFRYAGLNLGVSATADVDNKRQYNIEIANKYIAYLNEDYSIEGDTTTYNDYDTYTSEVINLGDLGRTRIGADLSFSKFGFTLNAEYFMLDYDLSDDKKAILEEWNEKDAYYFGSDFKKDFYYVALQYDFMDYFVYVMTDKLFDRADPFYFGEEGYSTMRVGGGWNINPNVVWKFQYGRHKAVFDTSEPITPIRDFFDHNISMGVSISF